MAGDSTSAAAGPASDGAGAASGPAGAVVGPASAPAAGLAGAGPLELSPAELGAWRGFLRVHAALARALDAELQATHGLSLSSYEVLIYLRRAPDRRLRMAELADSVILSRSGMTRLVDRLQRDGLLEREACESDGRGSYAVLTPAGEELLAHARPTHLAGVRERFLRHFGQAELGEMARWWDRILPGAEDLSQVDEET